MSPASQFLDFEQPIVDLEQEVARLKAEVEGGEVSQVAEFEKQQRKLEKLREDVFGNLTPYQRVRLSRHLNRPFALDYIERISTDFVELHGDRVYGDDPAVVGGIGKLNNKPVMFVGHQRGRSMEEKVLRNFGMAHPEGNRKALRLFRLAEKFNLPLVLFIDTQGAFPGDEAEKRGQAEAIARNILELSGLKTPIISVIIGEGGSGGALALGVCDRLLMLENAIYSVITPEGCASILWGKQDADNVGEYAKVAAESLKLTADALQSNNIVDEVVNEPLGGAHRDHVRAAELVKQAIEKHLFEVTSYSEDELLEGRYQKYRHIGGTTE